VAQQMPDHPQTNVLSHFTKRFLGKDRVNDLLEIRANAAKVEVWICWTTPTLV